MKRILTFFLVLTGIVAFAQSEIWGIHKNAGEFNGGVLYSIDSATNDIVIRHRFKGSAGNRAISQIYYDSITKKYIGATDKIIFSYNEINGQIEYKMIPESLTGNFIMLSDGYLYSLASDGLYRINPATLETSLITNEYYSEFPGTNVKLITHKNYRFCKIHQIDSNNIIWSQFTNENNHRMTSILLYSLDNDSVIELN